MKRYRSARLGYMLAALCMGVALTGCAKDSGAVAASTAANATAPVRTGVGAVEEAVTVPTSEVHGPVEPAPSTAGDTSDRPAEPAPSAVLSEEYRIGPGDVLFFQCFNDEALSGDVVVRYDGCISLPLIPDISVQGATRDEATERVRKAYEAEFLDPRISLSVRQSRSKTFHVMGSVARPGEQLYERPLTLLDAVNLAGGLRVNMRSGESFVASQGQLTKAFVIRHREGQREVAEYDLRYLAQPGSHPSDTPVYPGDIVYVPEAVNLVYVLGEVRRPSAYQLNERMTLLHLLALAGGGIEGTARLRQAVVLHEVDAANTRIELVDIRKILKTGADLLMQPGDIVYVPRKRLTRISQFMQQLNAVIGSNLSMYMQAYDAYYTDQRYNQLLRGSSSGSDLLTIEQTLRTINALPGLLPGGG